MFEPIQCFLNNIIPKKQDSEVSELLRIITNQNDKNTEILLNAKDNENKLSIIREHIKCELNAESKESPFSKERVKVYKEIERLL